MGRLEKGGGGNWEETRNVRFTYTAAYRTVYTTVARGKPRVTRGTLE